MAIDSTTGDSGTAEAVTEGVYVVVAAYNEAAAIRDVVAGLRAAYAHVVVVDDGSSDDTYDVARGCATYVLRHAVNRGQGAALQTGITFALLRGARYVVTFDADGQHRVEDIPAMLAPIVAGRAEITLGSRFLDAESDIPTSRRRVLRLAVWFTRVVNRMDVTDAHNGFRAFSRRAAEAIDIRLDRMAHASEILDQIRQSGLPYLEVPVQVNYTEYSMQKGQSSRNAFRIVIQYLLGKVLQ